MLYRPEAFEPLRGEPWAGDRVLNEIAAIVADVDAHFDPDELWPANEWDAWNTTPPVKDLYCGASGVLLALDDLRRRGLAETAVDLTATVHRVLERGRVEPDLSGGEIELPSPSASSLLGGETGLLLVACRLAPTAGLAATPLGPSPENRRQET